MKFPLALLIFTVVVTMYKADHFDYRYQAKWYDLVDAECNLDRQSPIELSSTEALITTDIPALKFERYNLPYKNSAVLTNNGHTASIQLPKPLGYEESLWQIYDKLLPSISGGPFKNESYVAESVHFHWGSQDAHGSEHVIDSQRYSLEMHIVHRNSRYQTVNQATLYEDGLAVLGVLLQAEPSQSDFSGLANIVDALSSIQEFNKSTEIYNILLAHLLGGLDTTKFFTYQGSLTTPPCSQAVTWIVFPQAISISHNQMSRFPLLVDNFGEILENNYRHLQAKGTRQVYLRVN